MPTNLTNADAFTDPVAAPSDSDSPLSSGALRVALQNLNDRTWYLKQRIGAANGIATLDGSSRVVQAVKGQIITATSIEIVSSFTTTSASFVDVTSSALALAVAAAVGDELVIAVTFQHGQGTAAAESYIRAAVDDGASGAIVGSTRESKFVLPASGITFQDGALVWRRVIQNAGIRTVRLQAKNGGSGTVTVYSFGLTAQLFRAP